WGPAAYRAVQVPAPDLRDRPDPVHVQYEAEASRGARSRDRDDRRRGRRRTRPRRRPARPASAVSLDPLPRDATAFVVVELQNDLVHPSLVGHKGLSGKLAEAVQTRGVLPRLADLLARVREAGVPVLYATKERHPDLPQPS